MYVSLSLSLIPFPQLCYWTLHCQPIYVHSLVLDILDLPLPCFIIIVFRSPAFNST